MLLNCHRLSLNCVQGDFTLSELSTERLDSCWTVTGCLECCWTITGSSCRTMLRNYCTWAVYWVTRFLLNCLMIALNVAKLLQALAGLFAGWFCSIWTVYWVNRFLLNCLLVALNWMLLSCHRLYSWFVYWVILLYLNCLFGDYRFLLNCLLRPLNVAELSQVLDELYAGWFCFIWTAYWVTRVLLNYLYWLLSISLICDSL